jgi:hypothetical protein
MDTYPICVYDVYRIYNVGMTSKELIKALEMDGCCGAQKALIMFLITPIKLDISPFLTPKRI